jgi:germination protein YpeB
MQQEKKHRFPLLSRYGLPVLAGLFGACLIAAVVFSVRITRAYRRAQTQLQNTYTSAFDSAGDHMIKINTNLVKMRVATSPAQQSALLYDVWRESGQAQCRLSLLPVNEQASNGMLAFVNRLGDYCLVLARRVDQGGVIDNDAYDTLRTLELQSTQLADQLEALRESGVDWQKSQQAWTAGQEAPVLDGIGQVSESIAGYPTLIYDGPFSERAENIEPKAASGAEVSYEEAVNVAKRFIDGEYARNEDEGAQVPAYSMTCTRKDGVKYEVKVTKRGGLIYAIQPNAAAATDVFPTKEQVPELTAVAKEYLEQRGFPEMQSAYAQYYAGAAVVNMVPVEDGVILYPDLVKVWVDIGTKEVIGLDAHNYAVCHIKRDLPKNRMAEKALTKRVKTRLSVENVRLAMIPYNATQERLCYEYTGQNANETFAVYLDAKTGDEIDIKLIIDADDGTFTY